MWICFVFFLLRLETLIAKISSLFLLFSIVFITLSSVVCALKLANSAIEPFGMKIIQKDLILLSDAFLKIFVLTGMYHRGLVELLYLIVVDLLEILINLCIVDYRVKIILLAHQFQDLAFVDLWLNFPLDLGLKFSV